MSYISNAEFAPAGNIQELSMDEIENVNGGIVPLALAAAVAATTVQFSFIRGVFDGIREKETAEARG